MALEPVHRPLPSPSGVLRDIGPVQAVNGLVGLIFAASGPVAIILTAGQRGGLPDVVLASWIFGAFFFNSLLTIGFCLAYRTPLVFFWTIPGTVLVGAALDHLPFAEVVGAYLVTGGLMLVLGLSGWVRRAMQLVPMPIVMAMVAGVFLQFGLDLVYALRDGFAVAAPMCAVFLLLSSVAALGRRLPPLVGALAAGIVALAVSGEVSLPAAQWVAPALARPAFSLAALLELVIPLAITVIVVQNGQGIAILTAARHRPPVNAITTACGAMSLLSAATGTVSTCLTGPVNALVSASGEHRRHYAAGLTVGLLGLVFGVGAWWFTALMLNLPPAFIAAIAGLAMLRVLLNALATAFGGACGIGALVTFLVTLADVPLAGLGAPFWGLVFGCAVSWLVETADYRRSLSPGEDPPSR